MKYLLPLHQIFDCKLKLKSILILHQIFFRSDINLILQKLKYLAKPNKDFNFLKLNDLAKPNL